MDKPADGIDYPTFDNHAASRKYRPRRLPPVSRVDLSDRRRDPER